MSLSDFDQKLKSVIENERCPNPHHDEFHNTLTFGHLWPEHKYFCSHCSVIRAIRRHLRLRGIEFTPPPPLHKSRSKPDDDDDSSATAEAKESAGGFYAGEPGNGGYYVPEHCSAAEGPYYNGDGSVRQE